MHTIRTHAKTVLLGLAIAALWATNIVVGAHAAQHHIDGAPRSVAK